MCSDDWKEITMKQSETDTDKLKPRDLYHINIKGFCTDLTACGILKRHLLRCILSDDHKIAWILGILYHSSNH